MKRICEMLFKSEFRDVKTKELVGLVYHKRSCECDSNGVEVSQIATALDEVYRTAHRDPMMKADRDIHTELVQYLYP